MDKTGYVCKGMNRRFFEAAKSGNVRAVNEISPLWSVANELLQLSNANLEDGMTFLKAKNMEGNTALHEAALGGSEQVVNALLEFCPDLVNEINQAGERALFKACEGGQVKIVEMLCPPTPMSMEYYKRSDGQTPLHLAVSKLSTDVIEKLLHHKPELATEVDNFDRSPLHMAALLPYLDNFLYPKLYRKIFLTGKMLIRNDGGLSCYKVDQNKQSALHVAVKEGNAALVDVILYYCRDCLEMVDNDGRIALHLAVNNAAEIFLRSEGHHLKFIIYSVTSERLINCIDNKGQTALDIALEKQNDDPQLYRAVSDLILNELKLFGSF
ncbi:hypothetical protein SUGI_0425320 [Cryptomeria japonica]|uniref:ankyrin repeat-containing protein At5g02620-like n=1 Tax=Cryptomeria japonica TaxID=3369 RepID=UPI002408E786|nr:ankyrin repeat-containing protein At5g02620-like [Cryptomeria japonica]GLJ22602.1 hypothetical protein SUGI_0425320 [Cryptomeria japonica]